MKKGTTITINNVNFEFAGFIESAPDRHFSSTYSTIWQAYDNPSASKVAIWEWWSKFFNECDNVYQFYVASRNSMQFTINAYFRVDTQLYFAHITKAHNYVYIVKA